MNVQFNSYLIFILTVIFFLLILLVFIISRIKNRGRQIYEVEAIESGNISIFFDKAGNVTIIPYAKDKYGVGRAVGRPLLLNYPYDLQSLGASVRSAMKTCSDGKACSNNDLMAALNCPGWKEFSAGKRNISVHFHEGHGVVMNTTTRKPDGSYQFNHIGFEQVVPADVSDKQLGEVLLGILGRCRA